jgi:tripartite-type tricarboxylate transporter receptor subunit TctC
MTNLAGERFKELIGVKDITHIPYKGAAPGITDLASGHIPMMTPNVGGPLLQFHAQGKVRILAIAANKRLASAPDIPIEAGLPGMVAANFNGCSRRPACRRTSSRRSPTRPAPPWPIQLNRCAAPADDDSGAQFVKAH